MPLSHAIGALKQMGRNWYLYKVIFWVFFWYDGKSYTFLPFRKNTTNAKGYKNLTAGSCEVVDTSLFTEKPGL